MDLDTNKKRFDWKLKKHLGKLVLNAGGIIFGGYVRDSIIHDYYSEKYYKHCDKDKIPAIEITTRYNDPDFYPEYKDRSLIPEDIDCFFKTLESLKRFEDLLIQEKFCFKREFTRKDATDYLPRLNVPKDSLSHIRYKITHINIDKMALIRKLMQQSFCSTIRSELTDEVSSFIYNINERASQFPDIFIDVLLQTKYNIELTPPFGPLDFECNGLLLSKDGLSLGSDIREFSISFGFIRDMNKMSAIIADILEKKAVLVKRLSITLDTYRLNKMRDKGWDIATGQFINIELTDSNPEDICIICHGALEEKTYKLKCCMAKYHKKCLIEASLLGSAAMIINNKCVMCKKTNPNMAFDISILKVLPD